MIKINLFSKIITLNLFMFSFISYVAAENISIETYIKDLGLNDQKNFISASKEECIKLKIYNCFSKFIHIDNQNTQFLFNGEADLEGKNFYTFGITRVVMTEKEINTDIDFLIYKKIITRVIRKLNPEVSSEKINIDVNNLLKNYKIKNNSINYGTWEYSFEVWKNMNQLFFSVTKLDAKS